MINGVLDEEPDGGTYDKVHLWPFEQGNFTMGITKYGEEVDPSGGISGGVGMKKCYERDGTTYCSDTFWPDTTAIHLDDRLAGWFINISTTETKNIWAFALYGSIDASDGNWQKYSDLVAAGQCPDTDGDGNNEVQECTPSTALGGRQTSSSAVTTYPLRVIYDGPRKFIGQATTQLWMVDDLGNAKNESVNITMTYIFNKDKEMYIVLKDVKFFAGKWTEEIDVSFGNREEWDIGCGTTGDNFYSRANHTRANTPYDGAWSSNMPQDWNGEAMYDIFQIVGSTKGDCADKFVGSRADWPLLTNYSVVNTQSIPRKVLALVDLDGNMGSGNSWNGYGLLGQGANQAPGNPYIVGQWNFTLNNTAGHEQFRGVTVKNLEAKHDGTSSPELKLDQAVQFYMNETFKPWDIYDAMHKNLSRFAAFDSSPTSGTTTTFSPDTTDESEMGGWVIWLPSDATWDKYSTFGEKVIVNGDTLACRSGSTAASTVNDDNTCDVTYSVTGTGTVGSSETITLSTSVDNVTVLYSAYRNHTKAVVEEYVWTGDTVQLPWWPAYDVEAFCQGGETTGFSVDNSDGTLTYTGETICPEFKVVYNIHQGRWDWVNIGTDASGGLEDSMGAAMVAAAFKNKNIEVGPASEGRDPTEAWANRYNASAVEVPWLLNKLGGNYTTDFGGEVLKMAWCISGYGHGSGDCYYDPMPVKSSNIISVGGPVPNKVTDYFNEFTNAFYMRSDSYRDVYSGMNNKILPSTGWNAHNVWKDGRTYGFDSSDQTGYALISTYKDIEGTVGFLVWGLDAEDTYYASKWFHEHVHEKTVTYASDTEGSDAYGLQWMNRGATDLVLKLDYSYPYSDCCPKVTIVERLGTISEKAQHDP